MANTPSIVGTWNGFVTWGESELPASNSTTVWTFHSDGSWTYANGGGCWMQVGGLVAWNLTGGHDPEGLVYSAHVTVNGIEGIMNYADAAETPGTGSFYAERHPAVQAPQPTLMEHDLTQGPAKGKCRDRARIHLRAKSFFPSLAASLRQRRAIAIVTA